MLPTNTLNNLLYQLYRDIGIPRKIVDGNNVFYRFSKSPEIIGREFHYIDTGQLNASKNYLDGIVDQKSPATSILVVNQSSLVI
jgi:hypothetical protein